ncbi:MAG: serine/threonine-protein kinase [Myxococcota bacterium]
MEPHSARPALEDGSRVAGKYQVERMLGRGAMGEVYRAVHVDLGRPVALKVLRNLETRDAILIRRFRREAQTAARLDHPNTVRVLDFGEDARGFLYLVMEHVSGHPLSLLLRQEGRLAWDRVLRIWLQVGDALQAAHDADVVHRDVKPSNILVSVSADGNETAKICDFGLAKFSTDHLDPEATQDPKWKAAGTPIYMAPEQAVGDPLDGRADIYASGVMAYQLIEGRPPFTGETSARILMMHVSKPPPPLSEAMPEVQALIHDCMAKELADRIPDGRTLGARCRAILERAGRPGPRRPTPARVDGLFNPEPMGPRTPPEALPLEAIEPFEEEAAAAPSPPAPEASIEALVNLAVEEAAMEATSDLSGSKDLRIEGLDTRRLSAAVAERAAYMYTHFGITYEPYEGPQPFFARDPRGELLGPMKRSDLWLVMQKCAELQIADRLLVSADRESWVSAHEFVRWIGQESLLDAMMASLATTDGAPTSRLQGQLERTGPIRVLAHAGRQRSSGRLVFWRESFGHDERLEVHLVNGRPSFVYSSDPSLQIPELLSEKGLLPRDRVDAAVYQCLQEGRALEAIISAEVGVDLSQWRNALMKQRMGRLLQWNAGRFMFDDQNLPSATRPFAESVLGVTKELAYRVLPEEHLRVQLAPFLAHPPQPTDHLRAGLVDLRLTQAQAQLLHRIFRARSLGDGMKAEPQNARMAAALLYVLAEADLLQRPGSTA